VPGDWHEYLFMTNYKKVLFELTTTPSTDSRYRQRIILSDMRYSSCPERCSEETNYCTAVSNRLYAKTEAMFSKCFPTLYIYIINQSPSVLNMIENEAIESSDSNFEAKITQLQDVDQQTTNGSPIFTLKPSHLQLSWRVIDSIVPQWASLSKKDCVDPAFCTTDWELLTWRSDTGDSLFSLCTASSFKSHELFDICTSHADFHQNYTLSHCENPVPYNPTLPDTAASILLLSLAFMGLMIGWVWCYNIRLTKTNEVPCDVCPFCPEWLFPKAIEDNPLYQDDNEEEEF